MFTNKTFDDDNIPKLAKRLYYGSEMFIDLLYQFVNMFLLMYAQYCGISGAETSSYIAMYSTISLIVILLRILGWI